MRISQFLLATLKETPADAEVVSHQLMLRAGLIRQVASGIYTWLPLGVRILQKVENIICQEMDLSGAQQILMPAIQPAELWRQSGRWDKYGPELLRLKDRHQREFCIGPTHEEIITTLAKNEIRSYRQLPLNLYQIQTKFRDEIRPRFGVMRSREFIMKDGYSFHVSQDNLEKTYQLMYQTYSRIFSRLGLEFRTVSADSGSIGGSTSCEFHVLAKSGEDMIAISTESNYAANVELAEAVAVGPPDAKEPFAAMTLVDTPDIKTIKALTQNFKLPIEQTIKTIIVVASDETDADLIALLVRGDHTLNVSKAEKLAQIAAPLQMADEQEIRRVIGAGPGSLGPVNLPIPYIADRSVTKCINFSAGANIENKHYFNINWGRDLPLPQIADIRNVVDGDKSPDGKGRLTLVRGIEVGHIFNLGTQYSEALNATVLNENGVSIAMAMGCYGIGVTRVVAAAIEQNHDEKGIIWPDAIAPFDVAIVAIGMDRSQAVANTTKDIENQLTQAGISVLVDDRCERPGVMFADMELIGIPHRLTIGARSLEKGIIEYTHRRSGKQDEIPINELHDSLVELLRHV